MKVLIWLLLSFQIIKKSTFKLYLKWGAYNTLYFDYIFNSTFLIKQAPLRLLIWDRDAKHSIQFKIYSLVLFFFCLDTGQMYSVHLSRDVAGRNKKKSRRFAIWKLLLVAHSTASRAAKLSNRTESSNPRTQRPHFCCFRNTRFILVTSNVSSLGWPKGARIEND